MALHIKYDTIKDWETTCVLTDKEGGKRLHPITQALGFNTMVINLHKITKTNWKDFYARVAVWESIEGVQVYIGGDDYPIKPEDVHNHIGLSTNVYENDSKAKFFNRHAQDAKRRARADLETVYREAMSTARAAAKEIK